MLSYFVVGRTKGVSWCWMEELPTHFSQHVIEHQPLAIVHKISPLLLDRSFFQRPKAEHLPLALYAQRTLHSWLIPYSIVETGERASWRTFSIHFFTMFPELVIEKTWCTFHICFQVPRAGWSCLVCYQHEPNQILVTSTKSNVIRSQSDGKKIVY